MASAAEAEAEAWGEGSRARGEGGRTRSAWRTGSTEQAAPRMGDHASAKGLGTGHEPSESGMSSSPATSHGSGRVSRAL